MDNKCKRRKLLKSEEVRIYDKAQSNKYASQERLRIIGYPDKPLSEAYSDCVSQYAW